jgi:hypothetical protein
MNILKEESVSMTVIACVNVFPSNKSEEQFFANSITNGNSVNLPKISKEFCVEIPARKHSSKILENNPEEIMVNMLSLYFACNAR